MKQKESKQHLFTAAPVRKAPKPYTGEFHLTTRTKKDKRVIGKRSSLQRFTCD